MIANDGVVVAGTFLDMDEFRRSSVADWNGRCPAVESLITRIKTSLSSMEWTLCNEVRAAFLALSTSSPVVVDLES